jgi:membrane protease YdiL (CAAX protease family)
MDVEGAIATFVIGLVYGYSFQRSGSILMPCLGHALAGTALLCIGSASFAGAP